MQRKDWFILFITLILIIVADQLTKIWSTQIGEANVGIFRLIVLHNQGAMLGLFSNLPAVLRVVTLSTSGAFILCLYLLIQYLIPKKLLKLRFGITILVGGILGNVLDRILHGYVIDFMAIRFDSWHSPVWNLADVIQWIGYGIMSFSLIRDSHLLWPDKNDRKSFWVNKKFQIKYSLMITAIGFFLSLLGLVFSYTYLKVTVAELSQGDALVVTKFAAPFLLSYMVLIGIFSLILLFVGKYISHQVAGPVYAFERFLKSALAGNYRPETQAALKLRNNDEFKHLEALAEEVQAKLKKISESN